MSFIGSSIQFVGQMTLNSHVRDWVTSNGHSPRLFPAGLSSFSQRFIDYYPGYPG